MVVAVIVSLTLLLSLSSSPSFYDELVATLITAYPACLHAKSYPTGRNKPEFQPMPHTRPSYIRRESQAMTVPRLPPLPTPVYAFAYAHPWRRRPVERLGELLKSGELKDIVAIPTSIRTKEQAESLDIPLVTLDTHSGAFVRAKSILFYLHFKNVTGSRFYRFVSYDLTLRKNTSLFL